MNLTFYKPNSKKFFTITPTFKEITFVWLENEEYEGGQFNAKEVENVIYEALEKYLQNFPLGARGYILETAHPVKFPDVVEETIGKKIEVPEEVKYLFNQTKKSILLSSSYNDFKEWLMNK